MSITLLAQVSSTGSGWQRDSMNTHYNVVIICPLTSKIKSFKGCPIIKPDKTNKLKCISQAIPFQFRTISKSRLKKRVGIISNDILEHIKDGVNIFLNY